MQNKNSNSTTTSKKDKQSKVKSSNGQMQSSKLMGLFEAELKDIYWVEKQQTKMNQNKIQTQWLQQNQNANNLK